MNTKRIRELNDLFRTGQRLDLGRIMITSGVRELVAAWPLGAMGVYAMVQRYDSFDRDNAPHNEHDCGSFDVAGVKCFWKLDYYDKTMEAGSEDPADPDKTCRVLTIMRADEY